MGLHLHFDCFSGISGDMTLGALVDCGVDVEALRAALAGFNIGRLELKAERVMRQGIAGTRMHVSVDEEPHAHRHLHHVIKILEAAGLSPLTQRRAAEAYRRIAEAEAHVHGSTLEKIHFHEVGAKDAIVDVAAAMAGVELLGATSFSCSTVRLGGGTVHCQHGVMPVPAPATVELLKGIPCASGPVDFELATPTGAAILATLLSEPGSSAKPPESLQPLRVAYGAGGREFQHHANYLRLMLCEATAAAASQSLSQGNGARTHAPPIDRDRVVVLETEIDDMSPEVAGYLMGKLLEAGALDAHCLPVQMKKQRPGAALRVIAPPEKEIALAEVIFRESTSFGLRRSEMERWKLPRRIETVQTDAGPINVKLGMWGDAVIQASPEFENCRAAAERTGRPLREVMDLARAAAASLAVPHSKPADAQ